jgi:hypothetical protein
VRNSFIRMAFLFGLMFSILGYAKTYEVKMTPCEINSQCKSCREIINVSYEVSEINKSVVATSYPNSQQFLNEILDGCDIKDVLNWSCNLPTISILATDGEVSINTNKRSSLFASHYEMCLVK